MYCIQCGKQLPAAARYCPACGARVVQAESVEPRLDSVDPAEPLGPAAGGGTARVAVAPRVETVPIAAERQPEPARVVTGQPAPTVRLTAPNPGTFAAGGYILVGCEVTAAPGAMLGPLTVRVESGDATTPPAELQRLRQNGSPETWTAAPGQTTSMIYRLPSSLPTRTDYRMRIVVRDSLGQTGEAVSAPIKILSEGDAEKRAKSLKGIDDLIKGALIWAGLGLAGIVFSPYGIGSNSINVFLVALVALGILVAVRFSKANG